ncbi:sulfate anion transporter 1-like [Mercenaria mercenaria]|uniref:sulfate anion transporter 1-like n=1 Tax=Mercenaria mercenaria TaxID=6596 RepID=UPI00234ECECD|nr:sulfate anion transporter 1-like [Mercenaria mercenaria]
MSASASRDNRRMSVTREIYRRQSRDILVHRNSAPHVIQGQSSPAGPHKRRTSGPKPHVLKRFYATVPDADRKYLLVPKSFRKAQQRPAKRNYLRLAFQALRNRVPVFDTVASYNFRENLIPDLVAGLAVTGLHFPQGLAYALLAGLPPGIGMVSTIFPVLIYIFFGSAAHTSIGTNAIVSIIIGDMLLEPSVQVAMKSVAGTTESPIDVQLNMSDSINVSDTYKVGAETDPEENEIVMKYRIALVAGATFYTGIIFVVMAIFRMGFLVTYLSQSFMSGFTTGVAVHIFSSQIKTALGLKLPPLEGVGKLVKLYYSVFKHITSVNIGDLVVSIVCVVILLFVKIGINERLKLKVPIPIDFILLVVATIISYFAKLPSLGVHALGKVELGIPAPELPAFTPAGPLIVYAIQIALVTFFLNISVIKIIARRNGYEISENIELNAYGMCNIIPAFFSNIPASVAPPRSSLLSSMGAKSTMNAVSTFGIMLALIFYFGQFFETCPKAVLASMIMVAMKDLLKQVTVLPKLWKVNKNDFTTWLFAAVCCVFTDIPYGLALGVLVSLLSVINQSQRGWVSVIGKSDSEDLYLDAEDYGAIHEIPCVKIVRMESSLYFATSEMFRKNIYKIIEKDSDKYAEEKKETASTHDGKSLKSYDDVGEAMIGHGGICKDTIKEEDGDEKGPSSDEEEEDCFKLKVLVIDCISVNFIDCTGLDMLKLVIFELGCLDISVYLARCSRYMLHLMEKSDMYDEYPRENVFIDLPDAVDAALKASKPIAKDHIAEMETEHKPRPPPKVMSFGSITSDYDKFIHRNSIFQPL